MRSLIRVIFTSIPHHLTAVGSKSSSSHSTWGGQAFNQGNFKTYFNGDIWENDIIKHTDRNFITAV